MAVFLFRFLCCSYPIAVLATISMDAQCMATQTQTWRKLSTIWREKEYVHQHHTSIPFMSLLFFVFFSFARSLCAVRGVFFPTLTSRPFRWLLLIVWGHNMTGYGIQLAGYVLTSVMFDPLLSINWKWNSFHSFHSWLSLVLQKNRPSRLTDSSTAKPSEPNPKGYHSMNHFLGSIIDHVSTNSRRKTHTNKLKLYVKPDFKCIVWYIRMCGIVLRTWFCLPCCIFYLRPTLTWTI